jgi:hypothetical protein
MYIRLFQKRCGFLSKEQTASLKKSRPKISVSPTVQDVQGRMCELKGWPPIRGASPSPKTELKIDPEEPTSMAIEATKDSEQAIDAPESPKLQHLTLDRPSPGIRRRPSIKRLSGVISPSALNFENEEPPVPVVEDASVLAASLKKEREEK